MVADRHRATILRPAGPARHPGNGSASSPVPHVPLMSANSALRRAAALLACASLSLAAACSDGPSDPGGSPEENPGTVTPAIFTASPLRLEDVTEIIPIGNLAPPGHTLPTEHAYFFFHKDYSPGAPLPRLPVYAPGSGTVRRFQVMGPRSFRVDVEVSSWLSYYLILLDMDTTRYRPGRKITAGEQLGVTEGSANSLDIGVVNKRIERKGFARPARYGPDTKHIDSPFRYFAEPLRGQVYARVNREGADKDGTLEVDVPGTLAGVWFRDDVPLGASGMDAWSRAIVFAPDVRKPGQKRVSIGFGLYVSGLFGVQPGAPEFSSVTPSRGAVGYRLDALDNSADPWRGVLMVQLAGADTLYAEFFPGSRNLSEPFTSRRTRYLR